MKMKSFSRVQLLATPWTAAYQAPPSMGFSRQEYRSGFPLSSPINPLTPPKYFLNILKTLKILPRFKNFSISANESQNHKLFTISEAVIRETYVLQIELSELPCLRFVLFLERVLIFP